MTEVFRPTSVWHARAMLRKLLETSLFSDDDEDDPDDEVGDVVKDAAFSQMYSDSLAEHINLDALERSLPDEFIPLSRWDVSGMTSMNYLFIHIHHSLLWHDPHNDITNWDVSNVTDMTGLFIYQASFNQDIGRWNVSRVTRMESMFQQADAFNQDIGKWNVSNVTTMKNMFEYAKAFNQDIGKWNIRRVKDMDSMFKSTRAFNQSLSSWSMKFGPNISNMFRDTPQLTQLPVGWVDLNDTRALPRRMMTINAATVFARNPIYENIAKKHTTPLSLYAFLHRVDPDYYNVTELHTTRRKLPANTAKKAVLNNPNLFQNIASYLTDRDNVADNVAQTQRSGDIRSARITELLATRSKRSPPTSSSPHNSKQPRIT